MPSKKKTVKNVHGISLDSDQTVTKTGTVHEVSVHYSLAPVGRVRMYEQLKGCYDLDTGQEYTQK